MLLQECETAHQPEYSANDLDLGEITIIAIRSFVLCHYLNELPKYLFENSFYLLRSNFILIAYTKYKIANLELIC